MRRKGCAVLFALAFIVIAWPAVAQEQRRQPAAGALALGAEGGFFVPASGQGLQVGAGFGGTVEFYLLSRLSIRAQGGTAGTGYPDSATVVRRNWFMGSLVYNWEADLWHPFVIAGVGSYWTRLEGDWHTNAGGHVGGGIEYFWRPNITIKLEGLYHFVEKGLPVDPGGATFSVGLKKYFW